MISLAAMVKILLRALTCERADGEKERANGDHFLREFLRERRDEKSVSEQKAL